MYIITARRMTSGELLKYRNGLFIAAGYESVLSISSQFCLTKPLHQLDVEANGRLAVRYGSSTTRNAPSSSAENCTSSSRQMRSVRSMSAVVQFPNLSHTTLGGGP